MSIGLKYILDKRRKKRDGTCGLRLRVTINRKAFEIGSGYCLLPESWDDKKQLVKSKCKEFTNITRINNLLSQKKAVIFDKLAKLDEDDKILTLSLQEIKNHIVGKKPISHTFAFWQSLIDEFKTAGRVGNSRVYLMAMRSVMKFTNNKDFPLRHLTFAWLKKYENWYLGRNNRQGKPNSVNGLSINMRTIRAVYNRAIKQDLVSLESYPFRHYTIRKEATRKRAISKLDLAKLKMVEPQTVRQERAKRYFFVSYYLMGASFIDLAFLRHENIINGRIEYKRRKTGRLHSIKMTSRLEELLKPFLELEGKSENDFLFPVLTNEQSREKQYDAARDEMGRYNKSLKELGKAAGLSVGLTSYVARHSFATIAKYEGMPTTIISEALGHSNPEITQVYLDSFEQSVLDDWNDRVQDAE